MRSTNTTAAFPAAVAGEVRAEMARKRISQRELANLIGTSQESISRRIRGEVAFDVAELAAIAKVLDVSVVKLLPADAS